MKVDLDHNGLVTLVRGCIQNPDQLNKLTDEELTWLYTILSRQESKQPDESKVKHSTVRVEDVDENTVFAPGDTIVVPIKENCKSLYDKIQIIAYRINCYITWQSNPLNQDVNYQFVANKKVESTIRPIPYESLSADQKDEYDEMIHLEKLRASSDISIYQECRFMFLWGKYMYDDKINNLNELRAYCKADERAISAWGMADRASYLAKQYPDQYAEFIHYRENSKEKVIRQPKVFKLSDINYGTEFIQGDSIVYHQFDDNYTISRMSKFLADKAREIDCYILEVKNADGSYRLGFTTID